MRSDGEQLYDFEGYALDLTRGCLLGERGEIALRPKSFELLRFLIENAGRLTSKEELLNAVWPNVIVSDDSLAQCISELRHALNDLDRRIIKTVPRRGYSFAAPVSVRPPPSAGQATADRSKEAGLLDKPSVAVLPFTNMSGDLQQELFCDGIAEDIITALSHCPWLFVTARNSSFTYKGRAVDLRQVGYELSARYVLEGSVRSSGDRVRITAQLVEAESAKHVWANRYDRHLNDVFAVQDEIADAVTIAIAPAVAEAELRRAMRTPPISFDAWAAYQRGLWHLFNFRADDNLRAQAFFREATDLDPTFAGAYAALAWALCQAPTIPQACSTAEAHSSAEALARRAVALDPADAEAHATLGLTLWLRGDCKGALAEVDRALAISPNLAFAHATLGAVLTFSGQPRKGLAAIEAALKLDPKDPYVVSRLTNVATAFYFCGEYAAASEAAQRAIRANPGYPEHYSWLAASLGQLGRSVEAKQALEKAIAAAPASFDVQVQQRPLWFRGEDHIHMIEGLRKAGWEG